MLLRFKHWHLKIFVSRSILTSVYSSILTSDCRNILTFCDPVLLTKKRNVINYLHLGFRIFYPASLIAIISKLLTRCFNGTVQQQRHLWQISEFINYKLISKHRTSVQSLITISSLFRCMVALSSPYVEIFRRKIWKTLRRNSFYSY